MHSVWLELSTELAPEELHHHDIVHFALEELQTELRNGNRPRVLAELRQHLDEIKGRRAVQL